MCVCVCYLNSPSDAEILFESAVGGALVVGVAQAETFCCSRQHSVETFR